MPAVIKDALKLNTLMGIGRILKLNTFGTQYINKSVEIPLEKHNLVEKSNKEVLDIMEVLHKLKDGYRKRDIEKVEDFVEELFIRGDETCILGTGTDELFLGIEQVKELLKSDWQYWGDVNIDLENIYIDKKDDVAWFATTGTLKNTFEDTNERYDNYVNFIKNKANDSELSPKQKITFINWVLALTYHQRTEKKREYLWPLRLSGVLLNDNGRWKFTHIQFSMPKANFPDERFENSKVHLDSYNKQNEIADKYLNNQLDSEVRSLLKSLETELVGQKNLSKELLSEYFTVDNIPYIIAPDNKWSVGIEQIKDFFTESNGTTLSLDLEHTISSKHSEVTWVTLCGTLKKTLTEDEAYSQVLDELESLLQANISSKEKLFAIHRSIAYTLKESATGQDYTCPIRLTAVVLKNQIGKPAFQHIHFSFPFYWILEGKLNSL